MRLPAESSFFPITDCQVPHEVETIGEPASVPADWPSAGKVEVKNLHVRYANDLPDVLKGVDFTVEVRRHVSYCVPVTR